MSDYRKSNSREDPRKSSTSTETTKSTSGWPQGNSYNQAGAAGYNMYNSQYSQAQGYYAGYGYPYNAYSYPQSNQPYMVPGAGTSGVNPVPPPTSSDAYPNNEWTSTDASVNKNLTGVADELNKQKENLIKEREIYEERVASLKQKLDLLIDQKDTLSKKEVQDRETLHIIKENTKLQAEIHSKIKDANNVIDILSGLIGDKKHHKEKEKKSKGDSDDKAEKINYRHYDPEIHWCRMCDVFPQSAKELLLHLHSKKHQDLFQEEVPWHKLPPEPKFPDYEGAPVRRLPIKGLQFFVPATAWYCRLCDSWIGDLHCASQHLMSVTHSQNYTNFVEQNPHWEVEWLKDREKALERTKNKKGESDSDREGKRQRTHSTSESKDKKKKKRKRRRHHSSDSSSSSSSSSSDEDDDDNDKSKSIRVAMRNKIKMLTESENKWDLLNKLMDEERKKKEAKQSDEVNNDKMIGQWIPVSESVVDKDKKLLDSLKEKLKHKQDQEKQKQQEERDRQLLAEKHRREKEEQERKRKQEQEEREREMEMRRRDKMSMKLKEKSNNVRDRGYRKRSYSRSPESKRRSRSISPDRNKNGYYSKGSPNDDRDKKSIPTKRLPFIGRMPLFKNQKPKKMVDEKVEKEIQREDYDAPRKTRFQPGNLARAFIPEPEVVCFPRLSTYPPIAPPPPVLKEPEPAPPTIKEPKAPPPPKIEKAVVEETKTEQKTEEYTAESQYAQAMHASIEYGSMYEDPPSNMMYQYGNVDYSIMYQPPPQSFEYMQPNQDEQENPDVPKSHSMPLEPPPLPPDDPNDDLALLGISSDDMAAQQMF